MPQIGMNGLYAQIGSIVKVSTGRRCVDYEGLVKSVWKYRDKKCPWITRLYLDLDNGESVLAHNCEIIG